MFYNLNRGMLPLLRDGSMAPTKLSFHTKKHREVIYDTILSLANVSGCDWNVSLCIIVFVEQVDFSTLKIL